ncbi:MAG: histidinol-phosphate transaminase [Bacteroidales bacterium]|nr:histidinol-phosphate transaminase [Bacteroidales bacterium]
MIEIKNLIRKNVLNLSPYTCARDDYKGSDGVFLDANENPFGHLNRYPDPYQKELKAAISKIKGVAVENIFLGNGSDEIIDLGYRVFCNPGTDKALTFSPTYGMYEASASINDVKIIRIPLDKNFQINYKDVEPCLSDKSLKLIWICSPNNPTGNCIDRDVVEKIISGFHGVVFIDEAYIDFAEGPSYKNLLNKYPNLIVMQTVSKAYGMASVRIGMAFMNSDLVHYFNKMKPPYNISTINQKAAMRKLAKVEDYKTQVKKIKEERTRLSSELHKLACVEQVYPSEANFILIKVKDSSYMYNTLIGKEIIIRNRNSVISNCLRITIGTKTENNKLIKALKEF